MHCKLWRCADMGRAASYGSGCHSWTVQAEAGPAGMRSGGSCGRRASGRDGKEGSSRLRRWHHVRPEHPVCPMFNMPCIW